MKENSNDLKTTPAGHVLARQPSRMRQRLAKRCPNCGKANAVCDCRPSEKAMAAATMPASGIQPETKINLPPLPVPHFTVCAYVPTNERGPVLVIVGRGGYILSPVYRSWEAGYACLYRACDGNAKWLYGHVAQVLPVPTYAHPQVLDGF